MRRATIYYDDGSTFELGCCRKVDPPPARGVQLIVPHDQWEPVGGSDYYVWIEEEQRFRGVDLFGLYDYLLDSGTVLFGRMMRTKDFADLRRRAKDEFDTRKP